MSKDNTKYLSLVLIVVMAVMLAVILFGGSDSVDTSYYDNKINAYKDSLADVRTELAESDTILIRYDAQVYTLKQRVDSFQGAIIKIKRKHYGNHQAIDNIDDSDLGDEFESQFSDGL